MSILKALISKSELMSKTTHGDLKVIAERAEGFTGADLQALLYTAQLHKINGKVLDFSYLLLCFHLKM